MAKKKKAPPAPPKGLPSLGGPPMAVSDLQAYRPGAPRRPRMPLPNAPIASAPPPPLPSPGAGMPPPAGPPPSGPMLPGMRQPMGGM